MRELHVRLSSNTLDLLEAEARRRHKFKNKSELARFILEDGLHRHAAGTLNLDATSAKANQGDSIERRLLELEMFAELALTALLDKRPGVADELKRRAREAAGVALRPLPARPSPPARPAAPQSPPARQPERKDPTKMTPEERADYLNRDPRKMTPEEKAAWKHALVRELTGQNDRDEESR
jgi:hypothetical protein